MGGVFALGEGRTEPSPPTSVKATMATRGSRVTTVVRCWRRGWRSAASPGRGRPGKGRRMRLRALGFRTLTGPLVTLPSPVPARGALSPRGREEQARLTAAPAAPGSGLPGCVISPLPHPHPGEGTEKGTGCYCGKSFKCQRRRKGTRLRRGRALGGHLTQQVAAWGSRAVLIRLPTGSAI